MTRRPNLVVAVQAPAGVNALFGNGDGSFGGAVVSALSEDPVSVAVGDLDGDGVPDAAVLSAFAQVVRILKGAGDGTFEILNILPAPDVPVGVALADCNGDQHLDVVVASGSDGSRRRLSG